MKPFVQIALMTLLVMTTGAVALLPSGAEACGPPACRDPYFAPPDGERIPVNAPALQMTTGFSQFGQNLDAGVTLTGPNGAPVPFTPVVLAFESHALVLGIRSSSHGSRWRVSPPSWMERTGPARASEP